MFQQITGTAAAYTFSVWLRGSVGGEQTYLYLTDGGTGYLGVTRVTLTTSWQRFSTTATLSAIAWVAAIGTDLRNGAQTSTPAQTIYAWGGQIESGTFGPTSFIPTTAATVTRARDSCLISPANMAPWFVSPGGSWMAEFIENSPASTSRVIAVGGGGGSQTPAYTSTVFNQFDGVTPIGTVNLLTLGVVQKGASAYAPSTGKVVLNGGAVVSAAMTTGYAALATNGVVFFADQAGAFAITGYLRRVQYWPRVLSDAEMQQVTT
jgi:hypothetical protein